MKHRKKYKYIYEIISQEQMTQLHLRVAHLQDNVLK